MFTTKALWNLNFTLAINTGCIERFLVNKNIRKILKVSHPCLEFSWSESYNKIKYYKRVSLEFSRFGSTKSNETLGKCLISLWFLFDENTK